MEKCLRSGGQACTGLKRNLESRWCGAHKSKLTAVLPASPLHLLQDLAYRQSESSDLGIALPPADELADISPLPLSIPVLLQTRIISLDALPGPDRKVIESALSPELDLASLSLDSKPSQRPAVVVSPNCLKQLTELSLSASSEIRFATQTQEFKGDEEWRSRLTFHDIWRIFSVMEDKMGHGFSVLGGK
jgi:hypothetical protein